MGFEKQIPGIYRLRIPFESLFTSVFLIESGEQTALVDCATTGEDVDAYIIPALSSMGYSIFDISCLVLTHDHLDHAGGLSRILELHPDLKVVREERELLCDVCTYALPGHTPDCIGVIDARSGTLISGDALQGAGVGEYRTNVCDKDAYFLSIDRIRADDRIVNILFSHEYEPWYKDSVFGRERVLSCLSECVDFVKT